MNFTRNPGPPEKIRAQVYDSNDEAVNTVDGSLLVMTQDQHTAPFDYFFAQGIGAPTTLASPAAVDDLSIVVTSATNFSVGNYIGIFNAASNRFYFGEALSVVSTTVTLDIPIDYAFSAGDVVVSTTRELNVDGSVTPQVFSVRASTAPATLEVDITRIIIQMETDAAVDLSKFGDIAGGLANGIVLRRMDGETRNIFNAKTNFDIAILGYDLSIYASTNPAQGVDGLTARITFAGMEKHGVAIQLSTGDALQLIVQDDLTDITKFRIMAQGHEAN